MPQRRSDRATARREIGVAVFCLAAAWGLWLGSSALKGGEFDVSKLPPAAQGKIDFARQVLPVLRGHCFRCHEGRDAESGVRLDYRAALLDEVHPLAIVGQSSQSRLIRLVSGLLTDEAMPPDGQGARLSAKEVGLLRAWIDQGLAWDDRILPPPVDPQIHWAFQPIRRPKIPAADQNGWARTPVDQFIAAAHRERGLSPAPEASRRTLIRRLSLDLTGLPPAPEEIATFLADESPDAYEQLIERLLASPRYGQRWGRHWLDLARWAESEGYESNHLRPYAWRYRDFVVRSFNDDKPFDQFVRQQIAGDELAPYSDENLIATGFLAAARLSSNEEDKLLQRNDVLVDIVNAVGSSLLGLTINCAQCHDHKFDPLTQRDFYSLQGFFVGGMPNNLTLRDPAGWAAFRAAQPPEYESLVRVRDILFERGKQRFLEQTREKLSPESREALDTPDHLRTPRQQQLASEADVTYPRTVSNYERAIPEEDKRLYDEAKRRLEELQAKVGDEPQTWGFYAPGVSPHEVGVLPMKGFYPPRFEPNELRQARPYVLVRGDVHRRGGELTAGWPEVLGKATAESIVDRPRSALADWLASDQNPLFARVWANRVWQHHLGRGIVATPEDFGVRGARPSHPELLDYLACELRDHQFSTKHLHRLIVLSATYRQSSAVEPTNAERDAENQCVWHFAPRRLEAEAIRDSALVASGELDLSTGGPAADTEDSLRRTLYLWQKREGFPTVQKLFDGPPANESCAVRYVSTVALQPLYLLNNPFMVARSEALARRVLAEAGKDRTQQIERAFELTLCRKPDEGEARAAEEFLRFADDEDRSRGDEHRARARLVSFCQALLNVNEFVYLE